MVKKLKHLDRRPNLMIANRLTFVAYWQLVTKKSHTIERSGNSNGNRQQLGFFFPRFASQRIAAYGHWQGNHLWLEKDQERHRQWSENTYPPAMAIMAKV